MTSPMLAGTSHRRKAVACGALVGVILLCFNAVAVEWKAVEADIVMHERKAKGISMLEHGADLLGSATASAFLRSTNTTADTAPDVATMSTAAPTATSRPATTTSPPTSTPPPTTSTRPTRKPTPFPSTPSSKPTTSTSSPPATPPATTYPLDIATTMPSPPSSSDEATWSPTHIPNTPFVAATSTKTVPTSTSPPPPISTSTSAPPSTPPATTYATIASTPAIAIKQSPLTTTLPPTTTPTAKATTLPPTTAPSAKATTSPPSALPATSPTIQVDAVVDSVAIVAYVPGNHVKFVNQTQHMLWASWNYSRHQVPPAGRGRTDLIIFAHANVVPKMPSSCIRLSNSTVLPIPRTAAEQCYVVEHTPAADDYWHKYGFMFSLAFLAEPAYRPLLGSYDRLLRTDTDVGITPAFMTFRPRQFVAGRGGYMYDSYTQARIKELALDLNMTHQGLHSIGSTWFGRANLTLAMVPKMLEVARFILESPKYKVEQGFPKWHLGVTSMYAGELVVNHFIPKEDVWINSANLDVGCNELIETAKVYHSHCWPGTEGYFTKRDYERGLYNTTLFPRDKLDMSILRDFFMAIVLYGY